MIRIFTILAFLQYTIQFDLNVTSYNQFAIERLRLYDARNSHNEKLNIKADSISLNKSNQFNSDGFHISRNLASSSKGHHNKLSKPWQAVAAIDGLRNEEVAVFVTSTAYQEGYFLRARYISISLFGISIIVLG